MIYLILLIAFILRFVSLNQSLWLDEAINVVAAKSNSLANMVTQYSIGDFHPPGYFFLIWIWTHLFGFSEIAVRIPSVIFGVLTVFLVYLLGKKLLSTRVGLIAAALAAVNPLLIYYSQEARPYAFAAFAVSLNLLFFLGLIRGERKSLIWYFLGSVLVLSSDYLAYLIIPAQLSIILLGHRESIKKWAASFLPSLVVWLLWLPFFLKQLGEGIKTSANIPGWKGVVGSTGIKPLILTYVKFIIGRISYPDKLIYFGLFTPVGLLFAYFLYKGTLSLDYQKRNIVLGLLGIPLMLGLLISAFVPAFDYFRLLFVLPLFILLVAVGINSNKFLPRVFLSGTIIVELICSLIYLSNPVFQREDWRGVTAFLKVKDQTVLLENSGNLAPLQYYDGDQVNIIPALKKFPANTKQDLEDLSFGNKKEVYLLDYLVDISDPQRLVARRLNELGFKKDYTYNFNGVGFIYHYTKL